MNATVVVTHPSRRTRARWVSELGARLDARAGAGGARVRVLAYDGAEPLEADYALGWRPPEDFFARVRGLRAFFSAGAGVDHLLRHPGLPPELPLVRVEDAGMGLQMAEYCLAEILRAYRLHDEYEAQQREGSWHELEPMPRESFRVGLFGIGVLGREVAHHLRAFGFPVSGFSRSARAEPGIECISGEGRFAEFLSRLRVLILLAPLTAQTAGLFDAKRLAMLPRGARLINVARGGLVVEDDLLAALDAGHLAGASLDVFATEPLPPRHRFWSHPRVRITPHVAAITLVPESAEQVADKISCLERGEPVSGLVDRKRGY